MTEILQDFLEKKSDYDTFLDDSKKNITFKFNLSENFPNMNDADCKQYYFTNTYNENENILYIKCITNDGIAKVYKLYIENDTDLELELSKINHRLNEINKHDISFLIDNLNSYRILNGKTFANIDEDDIYSIDADDNDEYETSIINKIKKKREILIYYKID